MLSIGTKELRDNLSRFLKLAERGEVIRVLRHGKEIVELRPIQENTEQNFLLRLKDRDMLGGGTGKIGPVKTVKNRRPNLPISDLVTEERR
jgi:antitoxin (DNA-binding transcriptional repressor) of toxin-antitoxin stability system